MMDDYPKSLKESEGIHIGGYVAGGCCTFFPGGKSSYTTSVALWDLIPETTWKQKGYQLPGGPCLEQGRLRFLLAISNL